MQRARVVRRQEDLGGDYHLLTLEAGPDLAGAAPGQFVMVDVAQGRDHLLPRPFSIFPAPEAGAVQILYRVIGPGTATMARWRAGDAPFVFGPLGTAFTAPPRDAAVIAVAGGIGLPPVYALAERLRAIAAPVHFCYGARSAPDLVLRERVAAAAARCELATDDGTSGHHGTAVDLLARALAAGAATGPTVVYACGPHGMLAAVARVAAAAGASCQVALEREMACGVGACLGCAVPHARGGYRYVCTDGPALDAAEVAW